MSAKQEIDAQGSSGYTDSQHVGNLVLLVGRLVQQVRKHDADNETVEKAMDYLRRANLQPSILRGIKTNLGLPDSA